MSYSNQLQNDRKFMLIHKLTGLTPDCHTCDKMLENTNCWIYSNGIIYSNNILYSICDNFRPKKST